MSNAPFLPLYTGDYFRDTVHLTGYESGAYLHLLMCMWGAGGGKLPNDPDKLARFCKLTRAQWDRVAPAVLPFFAVFEGFISSPRLTLEMEKYEAGVIARRERASLGGKAKALKDKESGVLKAGSKHANQNQNQERKNPSGSKERAPPLASPAKTRVDRGSRLSADWRPSEADRSYAASQGLGERDIDREAERFRNYWTAKAGSGGVKLDWPATWRNWAIKAAEQLGRAPPAPPTANPKPPPKPWTGPPEIRALAVARMGDTWAQRWLDPCDWQDVPERAILGDGVSIDKLMLELDHLCRDGVRFIRRRAEAAA